MRDHVPGFLAPHPFLRDLGHHAQRAVPRRVRVGVVVDGDVAPRAPWGAAARDLGDHAHVLLLGGGDGDGAPGWVVAGVSEASAGVVEEPGGCAAVGGDEAVAGVGE